MADSYKKITGTDDGEKIEIVNVPSGQFYGKGYDDSDRRVPDISKAKKILDWSPSIGLDEALTRTIRAYIMEYKRCIGKKGLALKEIKVSIVMPAYNAQAHIEGVFKRIPDQIWKDTVNCWVVNDGSSDKTGALIDKLSQANPKVRPVHFEKNRGYGMAVCAGLLRCKNDTVHRGRLSSRRRPISS